MLRRFLLFFILLPLIAIPVYAQQSASLWIRYVSSQNKVEVNLNVELSKPDKREKLQQAFAASTGLSPGQLEIEYDKGFPDEEIPPSLSLSALLSNSSERGVLAGQLDLERLRESLKEQGISHLQVSTYAPARTSVGQVRVGEKLVEAPTRRRYQPTLLPLTEPLKPLTFRFGWSIAEQLQILVPMLLCLLAPLLIVLGWRWRAAKALQERNSEEARQAILSGYLRLVNPISILFGTVWMGVTLGLRPERLLPPPQAITDNITRSVLMVSLPPILVLLGISAIAHGLVKKVDPNRAGLKEVLVQAGGQYLIQLAPFLCWLLAVTTLVASRFFPGMIGLITGRGILTSLYSQLPLSDRLRLLVDDRFFLGLGWIACALVVRPLLSVILSPPSGMVTVVLPAGALLSRLEQLAKQAGVIVRQAILFYTGSHQIANAFAASGNVVALTDTLVRTLTRREVDAVMAHELTHLKLRHTLFGQVFNSPLITIPLIVVLSWRIPLFQQYNYVAIPGLILALQLLGMLTSRYFERAADIGAAKLTGDPVALIHGLGKLGRLNGSPENWSRWEEPLLTHPTTKRRAENLIRAGLLVPEALNETQPQEDFYPLPSFPEQPVVSPEVRQQRMSLFFSLMLVSMVLLPVVLVHLLNRVIPETVPGRLWLSIPVVLGVSLATLVLLARKLGVRTDKGIEQQLRTRLGVAATEPLFALSPGTLPRHFSTPGAWDYGAITLSENSLVFHGERGTVSLPRTEQVSIRRVPGMPGLVPMEALLVTWEGRESTAVRLSPMSGASLTDWQQQLDMLEQHLNAWRNAPEPMPEPESLPVFPRMEGDTPRTMANPKRYWATFRLIGFAITAATLLSGLPPMALLVTLLPLIVMLIQERTKLLRFAEKHAPAPGG